MLLEAGIERKACSGSPVLATEEARLGAPTARATATLVNDDVLTKCIARFCEVGPFEGNRSRSG